MKACNNKICKNCKEPRDLEDFRKYSSVCNFCRYAEKRLYTLKLCIKKGKNYKKDKKGRDFESIKNDGCHFKYETRDVLVRDEEINGVLYTIYPSKV